MELIYSMRRKPLKCEPPHFERASDPEVVRPICTISCGNIIAFSSPTELSDTDGDTWGGHVYVCDLDTPWNSHKVVSTTHPVSALEWDCEGNQLLVATTEGSVSVYGQKDFLLNQWTCLYTANFPGEHILKGIFFHNGRRLITVDKKPDAPIAERIQALRVTPTLKGFGGVAIGGVCVITASGLIGAFTAEPHGTTPALSPAVATDSLCAHRERVIAATAKHKNGNILIAAICVSPWWYTVVRCGTAAVRAGGGLRLTVQPLSAITNMHNIHNPTSITWCHREDTDALLVAGSTLTLWKLTERSHSVHKLLAKGPVQGNTTPGGGPKPGTDCYNALVWQQSNMWGVEPGSWCTGVGSAPQASCPAPAPHAVLATHRKLHLLAWDDVTHHYICSRTVNTGGPDAAVGTPPKKAKYNNGTKSSCAIVSGVCVSWLGGVCVCVDTHAQIHVYKLPQPWADIPSPISVQQATSLLEYVMVSGYDYLDILLTLKHNSIETVYERLTESFQRQSPQFQQYYFHSWLKMRTALCRLIPSGAVSVTWLSCLGALWGTWAACGAALRVDDRPEDKPLAALLDTHHADHEKALVALETKIELCGEMSQLAPLRRVLQRACDIAATALASVEPNHHPQGYTLWSDGVAVSLLRKLVLVARGAGAGAGDGSLSRLLARLHPPYKPDFREECLAFCSQYGPRVWEALPRVAVSAPHGNTLPLYLEYGVEPESLLVSFEPPPFAHTDATPTKHMDNIRYMYLVSGCVWRSCGRCGARSLPCPSPCPPSPCPPSTCPPSPPATQHKHHALDNRFIQNCRCGGKWTLISNIRKTS